MRKFLLSIATLLACLTASAQVEIDESRTDTTVVITYSGETASVSIAANLSDYVTVSSGTSSHVVVTQKTNVSATTSGEITYILSGTTGDGEFKLVGTYKCSIDLVGLELHNPSGAALNIMNGKRVKLSAKAGTVNTLSDGASLKHDGCIYCKGHLELKGRGMLNVASNTKHAVYAKEYIQVKNLTLNVTSSAKDGINCKEYFFMESGEVNIKNTVGDGIQVELSDDAAKTAVTDNHEDENTGNFYMEGGALYICLYGGEPVKADGTVSYNEENSTHLFSQTEDIMAVSDPICAPSSSTTALFDLQGRRLPANAQPRKGLYVKKNRIIRR